MKIFGELFVLYLFLSFHSTHFFAFTLENVFKNKMLFIYVFIFNLCVSVYLYQVFRKPLKAQQGIRSPGAGVTGGCELPDAGSGN